MDNEVVDVETAIKADTDRVNVDHRVAAEALVTYYNTLQKNTNMTQDLMQHLTATYQQWMLTNDDEESDEDDD